MEGLSAGASGIAVVSFAVQLAESFKKLCDFWKSVKEAPENIREISADLELLSKILVGIAYEIQHVQPDATLKAALNNCCVKVKILTALLNEIEPGFASTRFHIRKWTAFKAVWKQGELVKFQEALDSSKGTLLLVQQDQYNRLSRQRYVSLEQSLATIAQSISSLSIHQQLDVAGGTPSTASVALRIEQRDATNSNAGTFSLTQSDRSDSGEFGSVPRKQAIVKFTLGATSSVVQGFLGTIRSTSTTSLQKPSQTGEIASFCEQDQYEYKTSYTIYPAPWLVRLGLHHGLHLEFLSIPTQGLKNTLKPFCPVPDDALIFEFCKQGNVSAVSSLLSRGHASVRDTDSQGYTPLHFAAENYHPALCAMLKSAGADINTLTHDARTPIRLAAYRAKHITQVILPGVRDTFRLLIDSMNFLEQDGDGWEIMFDLCAHALTGAEHLKAKADLLLWVLQLSSFELKTHIFGIRYSQLTFRTSFSKSEPDGAFNMLLDWGGGDAIGATGSNGDGYTLLHRLLAMGSIKSDVSALVARGPDLHRLGFDEYYTPWKESPTSLAMYSSERFPIWLRALVNSNVDLRNFIDQELEQNSELHPGWEKETLRELFAHGDRPDLYTNLDWWACSDCLKKIPAVCIQPYWQHLLDRISRRMHPYDPALSVSEAGDWETADLDSVEVAASTSDDVTQEPHISGDVPLVNDHELPSESVFKTESEHDSGRDSEASESEFEPELGFAVPEWEGDDVEQSAMTPLRSDCIYGKLEQVCMNCWLHYRRTGTRGQPRRKGSALQDLSTNEDESEDEFSPFHIHT